ncbi:MAG: NADH-quinone oxidoreductase subunit N [Actinomycetota bacterium]
MTPAIDLGPLAPELALVLTAIGLRLLGVAPRRPDAATRFAIALAGLVVAAGAALALWGWTGAPTVLGGAVAADRFGVAVRLVLYPVAAMGLLYAHLRDGDDARPEVGALVLFATSGMSLLAVASDLIVVFLGIEILSLALYVLTGLSPRLEASEASLKYFLLGSFASAFFLFGVAVAYGASGSTRLVDLAAAVTGLGQVHALGVLAVVLLTVGFAFKVGAVPFHMWTPDVYQGAPTPVTAFMSAGTKVAAFAAAMRVLDVGFAPLAWDWGPLLAGLAAVSVVVGSLLAIAQTDVKRMLAYSSIAHAGFILMGVASPGQAGMGASLFYLAAYAAMILGAFGVVMAIEGTGERADLDAFRGLGKRDPVLAAVLAVFLLSMAGIPPLAGFAAKLQVFTAAVGAGRTWLALVGVVSSVIAAFFYLRLVVRMYMEEPAGEPPWRPPPSSHSSSASRPDRSSTSSAGRR